ncbi:class I SAM-dependent methyltransferase [Aliiroseovarius sp. S1123]|nr:class I SAM-dependent methyltransferase [Aliiroseovarius sp. S1123]
MRPYVPKQGVALELASGTGEHIVEYARHFPGVIWQPTDVDPARLNSIDAWRAEKGVENMRLAQWLDASAPSWRTGPMSMIVTVNLMHLIDAPTSRAVIAGVARNLAPGAYWFLYGPFRTGGVFRSEGDETFHASLAAHDPQIGYKDLEKVEAWAADAGLRRADLIEMPANNLALVLRRAAR